MMNKKLYLWLNLKERLYKNIRVFVNKLGHELVYFSKIRLAITNHYPNSCQNSLNQEKHTSYIT